MSIKTSKVLKLTFTTVGDKTFVINLANPNGDLQAANALAAMNWFIDKDLFLTPSGALTGIKDIRVVDTITNDLYDPLQP